MANRKAAYGAPPEETEILVTLDKRVLYAAGGLLLVLVLIGGVWFAQRNTSGGTPDGGGTESAAAPAPAPTLDGMPPQISDADAKATAAALGLGDKISIVQPVVSAYETVDPDSPFALARQKLTPAAGSQGDAPVAVATPVGGGTAVPPPWGDLPPGAGATLDPAQITNRDASKWNCEVLANFPDANLSDVKLVPERTELVQQPLTGPRLGVSELSDLYTYNFCVVPMDRPTSHTFTATNVGDADLLISRVYTGCGCTALTIGGKRLDAAGYVKPPIVLKPGEAAPFDVQFDPRAEGKPGAQSKYVQIYSNDPTKTLFDPKELASGESRFRFVVEPRADAAAVATAPPAAP